MTGDVTAFCMPGSHVADAPTGTFSNPGMPGGWELVRGRFDELGFYVRDPESPGASPACPDHIPAWPDDAVAGHGLATLWQDSWHRFDLRTRQTRTPGDWKCQCGQWGTGGRDGHAAHVAEVTS